MDLTGTTIEGRPRGGAAPIAAMLLGCVLVAGGAATSLPSLVMLGIYPLILAFVLWSRQNRIVQLTLDDRGIHVLRSGQLIPYDSIRALTVNDANWVGSSPPAPIVVEHAAGRLTIPPRLSVRPEDLYAWLAPRIVQQPPQPCPIELAEYYEAQASKFGDDKVVVIRRRRRTQPKGLNIIGVSLLSLVLTAVAWGFIAGFGESLFRSQDERLSWTIAAFVAGLFGLTMGVAGLAISMSRDSKRQKAGAAAIVIGPAGMAMKQGEMKGSLRWDEVTGVKFIGGERQLVVLVRGAKIVILDVYDRSLGDIASMIRRNLG